MRFIRMMSKEGSGRVKPPLFLPAKKCPARNTKARTRRTPGRRSAFEVFDLAFDAIPLFGVRQRSFFSVMFGQISANPRSADELLHLSGTSSSEKIA
jgi:hypothetical protein